MSDTGERLIAALLGPDGPELGCDECFERLDVFVEAEVGGEDAWTRVPGMQSHLQGCPACSEEHDSLLAFIQAQR
jgi:hypothetical protein